MEIPITLAAKLAGVVVHADEMLGADTHHFDRIALEQNIHDPEVKEWIKSLGPLAPQNRRK